MNDLQTLQALLAQAPPSHSAVTAGRERLRAEYHRHDARSRTRTRRIAIVTAAASLGTLAAAVASLAPAPSAQAALISAAEATARDSFHLTATVTSSGSTTTFAGDFDLRHGTGDTSFGPGSEVRMIGGYVYAWLGNGRWLRQPDPKADAIHAIPGSAPYAALDDTGADPRQLLSELQSAAHVLPDGTASGAGWTGHRYAFTGTITESVIIMVPAKSPHYWMPARPATVHGMTSGTVEVDQQGRVRDITVTRKLQYPGQPAGVYHLVETFSDYGKLVSVSAPPADEIWVISTSGAPYARLSPNAGTPTSPAG
jgi:hypothetical protein